MGEGALCPLPEGYQHLHSISEPGVLRVIILLSKDCWKLGNIFGFSGKMKDSRDGANLCCVEDPGTL